MVIVGCVHVVVSGGFGVSIRKQLQMVFGQGECKNVT